MKEIIALLFGAAGFAHPCLVTLLSLVAVASADAFTVTETADSGAGSLREGISATPAGGSIDFNIPTTNPGFNATTGIFTITLTGGELPIGRDLTINGPANAKIVISGNNTTRVFNVTAGTVVITNLTITNGAAIGTAGMNASDSDGMSFPATAGGPGEGGGILNNGNLTLRNCTLSANNTRGGAGGSASNINGLTAAAAGGSGSGGGISNRGTLTLTNCTFSGNGVAGGAGGTGDPGGNGSTGTGGAIFTIGPVTMANCTFRLNAAAGGNGGNGLYAGTPGAGGNASGGGVALSGGSASLTLLNTIIAGNSAAGGTGGKNMNVNLMGANGSGTGPDVAGVVMSQGHNLIGRVDSNSSGWNGTDFLGGMSDPTKLDPLLGPLQDNGGPTPTHRPMTNSAAIDGGDDAVLGLPLNLTNDQRGYARKTGAHVDIGAAETGLAQNGPAFTVTNASDRDDGICTNDDCTLREALQAANANADAHITFASGVTGTIFIFPFTISNPLTITGPGARLLAISASPIVGGRIFQVTSKNVVITGLTITNGIVFNTNGGAIHNLGNLTLQDCTIVNSKAFGNDPTGLGGGIYSATGSSLTLTRCTFDSCSAQSYGGGVYTEGNLTATNCTFNGNSGLRGGGLILRGTALLTLHNCTFTNNAATDGDATPGRGGGGLFAEGGAPQHFIGNCLVAGNSATNDPDIRGNYTTQGSNLIGKVGDATGFANGNNGDKIGTVAMPLIAQFGSFGNNGGPTDTWSLLANSSAINSGNDSLAPGTDQRGFARNGVSDIGAFEFNGLVPGMLANISTRLRVETGDNALIGGFIVTGTQPKKVIVRAIGPSLPFAGRLANPTLELHGPNGLIEANENWVDSPNKQAIIDTTIPPGNDLESAIVATLPANNSAYTAVVRGVNDTTGTGVVEVYDLDRSVDSKLANISTRGLVQTGDNVLIAGTIVLGQASQKVIVRAIGPSLSVAGKLADPTLELRNANGDLVRANDNWRTGGQEAEIIASTVPPANDFESAIVENLVANGAAYTAIVRGVNGSTGIAVVEVYALP